MIEVTKKMNLNDPKTLISVSLTVSITDMYDPHLIGRTLFSKFNFVNAS